jgi:hypothetical protein
MLNAYLWINVGLWALSLVADVFDNGEPDKPRSPRQRAVSAVIRTAMLIWTVGLLAACGGGDCDAECLKDFGPVDCQADPKQCI